MAAHCPKFSQADIAFSHRALTTLHVHRTREYLTISAFILFKFEGEKPLQTLFIRFILMLTYLYSIKDK